MYSIESARKRGQDTYERNQVADRIYSVLTSTPKREPIRGQVDGLTPKQKRELAKLSLEDFELIRENTRVKNVMTRVLNMDVEKLTKIVTIAKGYKKQVESSSLKDKRQAKSLPIKDVVPTFVPSFLTARPVRSASARPARSARTPTLIDMLSRDLMLKIKGDVKSSLKYELYDWIPKDKLDTYFLSKNYNAVDYLKKNKYLINYKSLSANTNPDAIELLREKIKEDPNSIDWDELSKNEAAMELLKEQLSKEQLPKEIKRINWEGFCCNPNPETMGEIIKKVTTDYNNRHLYIHWTSLSSNTSNEAIAFLKENYGNIDWNVFSSNTNPEAIKMLIERDVMHREDLDWYSICGNKSAMALIKSLEKNRRHWDIKWATLARNTHKAAIEMIRLQLLVDPDKILWRELSRNPSAINILLDNPDKIEWVTFSGNTAITNPRAIELLKEKIKIEVKRGKVVPGENNISWPSLSSNPSIFKIQ